MTVTREDLERTLSRLRDEVDDPRSGIYGPRSVSWLVDREAVVFLGGGRAALLQLAHPHVAAAVDQHSRTRHDPLGRFQRTFANVYAMVFGDLDHAVASARRVHAIHRRIHGSVGENAGAWSGPYDANDEGALFWVQATLVDSAIRAFELVVRPLSAAERESYFAESRRFGALFGLDERAMPRSYDDFVRYNEHMWAALRVTTAAREMAGFLLGAAPAFLGPLARWYGAITAGLLPPPIRNQFGLPFGRREALAFRAALATLRGTYHRLPDELRFVPAYRDACARLRGEPPSSSPVDRLSRRLFAA
jgi:uncharacterized protein (DUF2236 family)